jgi:hypothetical protein
VLGAFVSAGVTLLRVDLSCFDPGASLVGGASVFGAIDAFGFTSVGAFLSCRSVLPGDFDSSGVGCWAKTAPASTSEHIVINVVNFFMVFLSWS